MPVGPIFSYGAGPLPPPLSLTSALQIPPPLMCSISYVIIIIITISSSIRIIDNLMNSVKRLRQRVPSRVLIGLLQSAEWTACTGDICQSPCATSLSDRYKLPILGADWVTLSPLQPLVLLLVYRRLREQFACMLAHNEAALENSRLVWNSRLGNLRVCTNVVRRNTEGCTRR